MSGVQHLTNSYQFELASENWTTSLLNVCDCPVDFSKHCKANLHVTTSSVNYNLITSLPTCLPCHMYSIASSARSKVQTESIISSNLICVADTAAQRSSMSCFEPQLIPLKFMLAFAYSRKSMETSHLNTTLLSMRSGRNSIS